MMKSSIFTVAAAALFMYGADVNAQDLTSKNLNASQYDYAQLDQAYRTQSQDRNVRLSRANKVNALSSIVQKDLATDGSLADREYYEAEILRSDPGHHLTEEYYEVLSSLKSEWSSDKLRSHADSFLATSLDGLGSRGNMTRSEYDRHKAEMVRKNKDFKNSL